MDTKKAVTGQHSLVEVKRFPPIRKIVKLGLTAKRVSGGPDKSSRKLVPERYSQTFKAPARPAMNRLGHFFDSDDLEDKRPKRAGTHIHLECIGGGDLSAIVGRR